MEVAKPLRCWIELLVAPAFLVLTAVALLSTLLPVLQQLASHGKTRIDIHHSKDDNINSPPSSLFNHPRFWIQKRFFLHFYVVGLISLAAFLFLANPTAVTNSHQLAFPPILLLTFHLARRWYECRSIHKYSTQSQMHLAGFICGIFHYLFLPFLLFDTDCFSSAATSVTTTTNLPTTIFFSLLCLMAQHEQYQHHWLLANLRTNISIRGDTNHHKIPQGRGFQYVSCPHYLAEIGIYAALVVLIPKSKESSWLHEEMGGVQFLPDGIFSLLIALREWRRSILLLWVTSNLTVTAVRSHQWYLDTFPVYESLNRSAIFPGAFLSLHAFR
jgi:3-oxo-5-alpha-steroid 4-dehydrogenase 3 / polyprenol reductase